MRFDSFSPVQMTEFSSLFRGRNGDFAVIFVLNVKRSKNGHGGCQYRFVTAAIPVRFRFLKPWFSSPDT